MPAPTHSHQGIGGLKPYVSVSDTLASIPPNAPDHDPSSLIFANSRRMRSWDATEILPRAMTTSGGQNYHPSGERDFTLREYAALQGFPSHHLFTGSHVKKQIGNAVPPCVAKVLFESIKKDLNLVDGIVEAPELIE
jgi:DNA (cytosine-5)-methyltransferase 1